MIYLVIIMFSLIFSMEEIIHEDLLSSLKSNVGWQRISQTKNGTITKIKNIVDMDLSAILVEREIEISPIIIQNILIDILNYNRVLKSSGSLQTTLFKNNNNSLDGYQYIESGVPFISDRKYCFRMNFSEYPNTSNILMEWYLLNLKGEHEKYIMENNISAVYLDYGAGIWIVEEVKENKYIFSYRLFMDPGGYIPNFIIDKVNQSSIYNLFNDVIIEAQNR